MKLIVNGKEQSYGEHLTVGKLLAQEDVTMPEMVSVEVNGNILKRSEFEFTGLNENDRVEFLYFMGGGSGLE